MSDQAILFDTIHPGPGAPAEVPRRSFSSLVIEKNRIVQKCSLGHFHAIYRRSLRRCFVSAMRALAERGAMSTSELFSHFSTNARLAGAIKSHFAEAQLWGFVENKTDGRWKLTGKGGAFLRGEIQVFRHVWPRDQQLPEECQDTDLVYVHDLAPEDYSQKEKHVEYAVSA